MMADRNITVLKVLKKDYDRLCSYYKDYIYQLNKVEHGEIGEMMDLGPEVDAYDYRYGVYEGFHSYLPDVCIFHGPVSRIQIFKNTDDAKLGRYGKKPSIDFFSPSDTTVLVECRIPIGSEYYVNERNEVVSDKIVIVRELDDFVGVNDKLLSSEPRTVAEMYNLKTGEE